MYQNHKHKLSLLWMEAGGGRGAGTRVAWSRLEKYALREQIRKWWCNINWWWCVPGSAGLSGVCLPKEGLSGAERDRRDESLTLSVSWWRRGGLGKETPSPTDTQINTLPVYGEPAGTHPDNQTDRVTQWERQTEWMWSPWSNIKIKILNMLNCICIYYTEGPLVWYNSVLLGEVR